MDSLLGTQLAGYRIESVVGRGGMSVVYLAEHLRLKRKVALKLIAPDLAEDSKFRERFLRESELAAAIEHPNIIPIHDADEVQGVLYIAMRYVDGTDLKRLLEEQGTDGLEPRRALGILSQVASALDAAHARGLVHRDVKPANVLLATASSSTSGEEHVYLSDFGLTKRSSSDSGITATGQFVGTLDYAAPEQFEGKPLDARTDVYSFGCVLYQCLTGRVPYEKDNQAALTYAHLFAAPPKVTDSKPELPPAIDDVVAKAMAKKPEDRYSTCTAVVEDARRALGEDVAARPGSLSGAPARRSRRTVVAGAALAAVIATAALAVVLTRGGGSPRTPAGGPRSGTVANAVKRIDPTTKRVGPSIPVGRPSLRSADERNAFLRPYPSRTIVVDDEGTVWIANGGEATLSRVEPASGKVTTIRLPASPTDIAIGFGAVWVTSNDVSDVFRVDPATNRVTATIPVGDQPGPIVVEEGAGTVWVADLGGPNGPNGLSVIVESIDPSTNQVTRSIGVPGAFGLTPAGLAVADGSLWMSSSASLFRIDPRAGRLVKTIDLDGTAGEVVPNDPAGSVWVTSETSGGLVGHATEVDTATGRALNSVTIGCCPGHIAVGGGFVWVTDASKGSIDLISEVTGEVTASVPVGRMPSGIAVANSAVWVTVDSR